MVARLSQTIPESSLTAARTRALSLAVEANEATESPSPRATDESSVTPTVTPTVEPPKSSGTESPEAS